MRLRILKFHLLFEALAAKIIFNSKKKPKTFAFGVYSAAKKNYSNDKIVEFNACKQKILE